MTIFLLVAGCDSSTSSSRDLSMTDDARKPMGQLGDPCGGNIANPPPPCVAPLVCRGTGPVGDVGGTCEP